MIGPLAPRTLRNLGLALLLGCCLLVSLWSGDNLRYVDETDYAQLALSILHDHRFSDQDGLATAYRPPGYPAFIAAVYAITEHPVAVKLANAVALVLACLALGAISRRFHPKAEAITPFLVIGYPLIIYTSSVLYPQVLGCMLLTFVVLEVSRDRLSFRRMAIAGLAYGMLILAIPYFMFLLPVLGLYIAARGDGARGSRLLLAVAFGLAAALVVVPWTVRNFVQFQVLIPVSTNGGWNLYMANSPVTTPTSGAIAEQVLPLCRRVQPDMNVYQLDGALGKCAVDWVTENPGAAARLYVGKLVNYFNFRNELATRTESNRWGDRLEFVTYYPLLLMAIARVALFRRRVLSRAEVLIFGLYFLNALISAIYFTRIRFRIPFDFLLITIEAAFLVQMWDLRAANPDRLAHERDAG